MKRNPEMIVNIYQAMLDAGVEIDNHETDLYVPVNDITKDIVDRYKWKSNVRRFTSQVDGKPWHDIPFAYSPAWERRGRIVNIPMQHRKKNIPIQTEGYLEWKRKKHINNPKDYPLKEARKNINPFKPFKPATYFYSINLDERGEFYADVRSSSGKTVFEFHGYEIFEEGWMKHPKDLRGLKEYLVHLGIMKQVQDLVFVNIPIQHRRGEYINSKKNPPISTAGATEIYDKIEAIEAIKGNKSLWPKQRFRHDFKLSSDAKIYGLSDGSLLVRSTKGKKLWKNFNYSKEDAGK